MWGEDTRKKVKILQHGKERIAVSEEWQKIWASGSLWGLVKAQTAGLHPKVLRQQAWGGTQETESLTSPQVILWLPVRDPLSEKHWSMKRALHTEFQMRVEMEVLKRWEGSRKFYWGPLCQMTPLRWEPPVCLCHLPASCTEFLPPVCLWLSLTKMSTACRAVKESKICWPFMTWLWHLGENSPQAQTQLCPQSFLQPFPTWSPPAQIYHFLKHHTQGSRPSHECPSDYDHCSASGPRSCWAHWTK